MTIVTRFVVVMAIMFLICTNAWADNSEATKRLFEDAGVGEMFSSAYRYALFPNIGKGGVRVGGAYGKGRVYEKGEYIGDTSMVQVSIGFQLGAKGFSQVVFFRIKEP